MEALKMKKRILILLSEWGYWGEELVGPLHHFKAAEFEVEFVTPTGKKPKAIPVSMDPEYIDPPLGRPVTSEETAKLTREIEQSTMLNKPINLSEWLPERPYLSEPDYLRKLEAYNIDLLNAQKDLEIYDCLLLVGGSGPIIDMANNRRVHDLIFGFLKMKKWIAAECYGVACFAFARDWETRKSIILGKHMAGHPLEYDYKEGYGFVGIDVSVGCVPYPLEFILRDAVGPDGDFHGNVGKSTCVVVDYPFITSRSTASSYLCGEMIVKVLSAKGQELHDLQKDWYIY
jgi:putative intracellular protease/amidase